VREIRMLRAMWRGLETEPRTSLHGHEGGNPGHSQGMPYGPPRQPSTLPSFIVLGDGFSVGPDTEFTAIVDPSLVP
jgi:hypothetical protein